MTNQLKSPRKGSPPKLSREQRATLLRWIASGFDDFTALRPLMSKAGFPEINRQAVHYYTRRFAKQPPCPTCGQAVPRLPVLKGEKK